MHLRIQSFPPLGEVTTSPAGPIQLNIVLEVPKGQTQSLWEVEVWNTLDGSSWFSQKAELCDESHRPFSFHGVSHSVATLHYATTLNVLSDVQFTLKFRRGPNDSWNWAKDICGSEDAHIVVLNRAAMSPDGPIPLPELSSKWSHSERASQSPGTRLWLLETYVKPSEDDTSSFADAEIGKPWGLFHRWFALVRHESPWLGPRHGKEDLCLDQDAIMCAFQSNKGQHVVLLAVTPDNNVESVLRSNESGGIKLHARSDSCETQRATILVSLGGNFDNALAAVMYEARSIVSTTAVPEESDAPSDGLRSTWREHWADGLGYCTWNALGTELSEEKLHKVLDDLSDNGVKISNLIIDDGWQAVTERAWSSFEARKSAFPDGLKATVSRLRADFPDIDHIAVWHAIVGYWGGISSVGDIAERYNLVEVDVGSPYHTKMHVVDESDVDRLYKDFYEFLDEAGIDSVKTDAQHMLDCFDNAQFRRRLISAYLDAWTISSLRHFDSRAISCMSQFPQSIYHSQIRQTNPAFIVRNSNDYFPDVPASHKWHVWANAHNSLLTRYLNVLPDWDMFQTKHEYAGFHAAARCVSGGPVYITDVPGEHDIGLIKSMTGTTVRGKTVVFRPSVVGRSTNSYISFGEEGHLLKVGSYHGPSGTGSPILGVFNTTQRPVTEIIPLSHFTGAVPSLDYVVWSHQSRMVSPRLTCGDTNAMMAVSLDVKGYDILTATPLALFPGDRFRHIWVGNMGLLDKMTGCAGIVSSSGRKMENKRLAMDISVKAFGLLGIWISTLPEMSIDNDFMVMIQEEPVPRHVVRVSESSAYVLEVDLETAWNDMKLHSRWSNEIAVKVYFST